MTQLRIIQRKRYNQWAIKTLQDAQHQIDNSPYPITDIFGGNEKKMRWREAQDNATGLVKMIEPTLLEPAVAPFYEELLSQLGVQEKGYRTELLKQVVNPRVPRKILDDF